MKRNVRPCSVCKISQQVQDVGLNRDVQGGDAFVGHEKAGNCQSKHGRSRYVGVGPASNRLSFWRHVGDGIRRDPKDSGLIRT